MNRFLRRKPRPDSVTPSSRSSHPHFNWVDVSEEEKTRLYEQKEKGDLPEKQVRHEKKISRDHKFVSSRKK